MIVYNNKTKEILAIIPDDQKPSKYPNTKEEDISILIGKDLPSQVNMKHYYIENDEVLKRPTEEIDEINKYRRLLTEEERLNIKLKPSKEEINKAENTLEILTTLQEVGLL